MKKLMVLVLVLAVSTIAHAGFNMLPVGGDVDTKVTSTISISLVGAGNTAEGQQFWILCQNNGAITGGVVNYQGIGGLSSLDTKSMAEWNAYYEVTEGDAFDSFGYSGVTSASNIALADATTPPATPIALNGTLVSDIVLGGFAPGTVTLTLLSGDFATVYDTQTFNIIPEPITVALLGLGGLFIRRRKVA